MLNPSVAGLKNRYLRPSSRLSAQPISYSFAHACYYFARLAAQKREWQRVVDAVETLSRMTENALAIDVPAVLYVFAGRLHAFALLRYLISRMLIAEPKEEMLAQKIHPLIRRLLPPV